MQKKFGYLWLGTTVLFFTFLSAISQTMENPLLNDLRPRFGIALVVSTILTPCVMYRRR